MLSNRPFSAISVLNLCLVVYVSLQLASSSAFEESPDESCTLNLTLRNFRLVLSWELKNKSIPPTHYTFQYTIMSKPEALKVLENCTNITESSCDVTDEWGDMNENYVPIIEIYRRDSGKSHCGDSILATDITVEPPEFEVVGFTDHINVIVKLPPVTPKIYGESIWKILGYTPLVIKEQAGKSIKMHKPKMNNATGNFTYVLRDLLPKTNYCVSVYFEAENPSKDLEAPLTSPLKCTLLQPDQESGSSDFAKVGIIIGCLIMVVFIITIMLKRIGYICLKNNFPKVLNFHNFLSWIFPELPPSEAVDKVEVIPTNKKKKVWNYDYGDESDSDDEVPKASATGYTMHGLMGKLLNQASDSSANPQESHLEEDSAAEESDAAAAEAGAEPELCTEAAVWPGLRPSEDPSGPYERRESMLQDSFPGDDSSSVNGPEDKVIFNVNLNSVFLRALHDDSEEASEVLSLAEDMVPLDEGPHRTESGLLMAGGDGTQLPHPGFSSQSLWTEDESSEKTDTSDSDADTGDGYIMR
ncbi:interferon alpha/beta receptor 2 isoform X1 [Peromyscus californicus insignis]|uniref:interferon alpha/beta receptor 2 isoform X1 n=2 Tax=Peromyscus californicus insignis TaxID=564181 RepID=UPI0022A76504|nr:interferon alpha/beta receptor 2 isoform X1 [Peromyscus californicus insignis]XP_052597119.1 interferon alpha/beta receptor 2 isoform X1 [Peromyscus californicus insignis]XP_052597120.1 interferon alpha/beta receptor 2 isoform X1 [Peromyscus californicus insignis]